MGAGFADVGELAADLLPGLATIVGAMDHLAEPVAWLTHPDQIGINR